MIYYKIYDYLFLLNKKQAVLQYFKLELDYYTATNTLNIIVKLNEIIFFVIMLKPTTY